ncbi:MAG: hypothetical protein HLUCCO02_05755 [Idiomarinaceae bacterium HL-53]|nr:MAG: hypothetical protein HLUCCO02_05755 [Idiomarinaceae bacterium HL-53]CUS48058.1 hypothetical protein Ga0003345_0997 [Idiomarinaceae bacterium HL-53]
MSRLHQDFYRNGPNYRGGANVSFRDIVQTFNFYHIKIGRWVTPAEEQLSANLFYDALKDLQTILQVPASVISMAGRVALSFGTGGRPGACAHYQPAGRVLALAKNAGGGSLAHEWFHAFDHHIGQQMYPQLESPMVFASRAWLTADTFRAHPLNQRVHAIYAKLFLDEAGEQPSAFFNHCKTYDSQNGSLYYSMPEEMAARAFEKVIQTQKLKNHFLVSGCLQGETAKLGLYPNQAITQSLQHVWFDYFSLLGEALDAKYAEVRDE